MQTAELLERLGPENSTEEENIWMTVMKQKATNIISDSLGTFTEGQKLPM